MTTVPDGCGTRKGFVPVSAAHPCPICRKPDWCLIAADGTAAICARTEAGSRKRCGDAGWLHRLTEPAPPPPRRKSKLTPRDWPAEAVRFAEALTPAARDWIHARLGLPVGALDRLPLLGVSRVVSAGFVTTWPEAGAAGAVVGITERTPGNDKDAKKMILGGKRGLTLPGGWRERPGPVFVVEGPTDAAAMSAAGLSAVGRPSKDGGGKILAGLFAGWPTDRPIVVVGENDPPAADGTLPGRDAAERVADGLAESLARPVRWALPPTGAKDVRGWLTSADRGDTLWPDRGTELAAALLATGGDADPPPPPEADGQDAAGEKRPMIFTGTDEFRVNAQATAALAGQDDVYQRGGLLVHVLEQEADSDEGEAVRRPAGVPVVRELAKPLLRERLTRCAQWVTERRGEGDEVKVVPVHPPGWAVEAVHARGRWPRVRRLEAVVTHPVLLPDGSLLAASGYHHPSGLLACLPPGLAVRVPDAPTAADAAAAVATLFDPLEGFPFETPAHRAALVAGLLTPLAWFAFDGPAPLFLIDKNVRGAGAGLLADVVSLTLTGRRFAVMSYTNDREELRKRITTLAIEGERLVLLDNLSGAVGNDILDAALTAERWKDRVLGGNKVYDGPLHVCWFGTGNNVVLQADTSRRVCHVRMESLDERPELRDNFRYRNLRAHVRKVRGQLMSAALTVLRGWVVAGRPTNGLKAWGSYEPWSDVVREAVVFAGLPDPGDTRMALQTAADRDAGAMGAIIVGLERLDPDRRGLTAADIVTRLKETSSPPEWLADMRSAVEDLCGKLDGRPLGLKFRGFRRRNFNGKMLDKAGEDRMSGNRWAVFAATRVRAEPSPAPPAPPEAASEATGDAGGAGDDPPPKAVAPLKTPKRRYRANPNRGVAGLDREGGAA